VFVKNAVIRGQVAILSEQLWTRHFGRRADIVGRPITLDDRQVTVVGVLPAPFYFCCGQC
jgi:MacB-like periplasmic core domain